VTYAILASGRGHQAGTLPARGMQLFTVPQAFPGTRRVKRGPASIVRIVTLVRASGEVRHAVPRDQQFTGGRRGSTASFCQPVLTEAAVHLA
jgi:hypothetical protein